MVVTGYSLPALNIIMVYDDVFLLNKKKACGLKVFTVHQVPKGLESNKGNIYMASSSPPCVLKSYYEQFQSDFSMFLRCRSEELVERGSMVLTFLGRRSDDPSSKECCYIWELFAVALSDMVREVYIQFLNAAWNTKITWEIINK